jgi:hypothetical protein
MPKAAINKDDLSPGRENDVGAAREILAMQAKTIAHRVDDTSYGKLRERVLPLYLAHYPTAHSRIEQISHERAENSRYSLTALLSCDRTDTVMSLNSGCFVSL